MTRDPLASALELPRGARFYRCALQVNPHGYREKYRGQKNEGSSAAYIDAVMAKAQARGIEVLAVTDHHDVSAVDAFRARAPEGVFILPGFEVTSSEDVHILCIYPPQTSVEALRTRLHELRIQGDDTREKKSEDGFSEILRRVDENGGVSIAAHVTGSGGILGEHEGLRRIAMWKDARLLAVQIPGDIDDLPLAYRQIVRNVDPQYRRVNPRDDRLAVAVVNARDVSKPNDIGKRGASCRIKMSRPSIEGLRQAFLDPLSRVRLDSDGVDESARSRIETIAWEGGFLDGVAVRFSEQLNTLIGGRGTGKSTIVESVRFVLGLSPSTPEAERAHRAIVRGVLENGTTVHLRLSVDGHTYDVERTVAGHSVVRDENGETLDLLPEQLVPGLEIYGQREISELAGDPVRQTRLLARFLRDTKSRAARRQELRNALRDSRQDILNALRDAALLDERLQTLPALREDLRRMEASGLEERLREKTSLLKEERVFATVEGRLESVQEGHDALAAALPIDRAFLAERALADFANAELLGELDGVLAGLHSALTEAEACARAALDDAATRVEEIRQRWKQTRDAAERRYERVLRELQGTGVDAAGFVSARERLEGLQPLKARRSALDERFAELYERRKSLLAEWREEQQRARAEIDRAATKVSRKLHGLVLVSAKEGAESRRPLEDLLDRVVGGRLSETKRSLREAKDLPVDELAQSCRQGAPALKDRYRLPDKQAEALVDAGEALALEIEELAFPPSLRVKLNVADDGDQPEYRPLDALSTGQKATALLFLLLLLGSSDPLVIDQPEDDLDNRFVMGGIVPRIRAEKARRQLIFSTHNANIPVLGDAELVVGLETVRRDGKARGLVKPDQVGSIDDDAVRRTIEQVLEGGRAAFERRREKYGDRT